LPEHAFTGTGSFDGKIGIAAVSPGTKNQVLALSCTLGKSPCAV
jgi:hypothetical protein